MIQTSAGRSREPGGEGQSGWKVNRAIRATVRMHAP
jgi:hypothetical protein